LKAARWALPIELEKKREEAKIAADQFEAEYTAKQKRDIAKLNSGRQQVINSQTLTDEEKEAALKVIDLEIAGVKPDLIPKEKSQFPEGRGPGAIWTEEDGSLWSRDMDGTPRQHDFAKTKQGVEYDSSQKELALNAKHIQQMQIEMLKTRAKIASEQVTEIGADGLTKQRMRTKQEVDQIMDMAVSGMQMGGQQQGGQGEVQQPDKPWYVMAAENGINVTERDINDEDPQAGYSRALIRTMNKRYPSIDSMPPDVKADYLRSVEYLRSGSVAGVSSMATPLATPAKATKPQEQTPIHVQWGDNYGTQF
jgi:hypothetical protein